MKRYSVFSIFIVMCVFKPQAISNSANPWDCSPQSSLPMDFSQQEYWSGAPFPPLRDLPNTRIKHLSHLCLALAGWFFTTSTTWEAQHIHWCMDKFSQSFNSVQFSYSVVSDSATPWTAARQASLSISNSRSLLKLMSIELVIPSKHLILCCPLLLPPSIFPRIRVFSNESALRIRWPKLLEFQLQHRSFRWIFRTDFL